jgi:RNA polymerase sigma factor (sigma-70 family)
MRQATAEFLRIQLRRKTDFLLIVTRELNMNATTSPATEFEKLIAAVAAGSDEAVWELAQVYTPYILRAVRYSLSPELRQKLDSMDFAQTLWASLLLRPTNLLQLRSPEELIRYLAGATRNKVAEKARRYRTRCRDMSREKILDAQTMARQANPRAGDDALYSREDSPSTIAVIRDQWRHIVENASERDQEMIRLRRCGLTFDAIAERLNIDEKTVRRVLQRLIEQFAD